MAEHLVSRQWTLHTAFKIEKSFQPVDLATAQMAMADLSVGLAQDFAASLCSSPDAFLAAAEARMWDKLPPGLSSDNRLVLKIWWQCHGNSDIRA